MKFFLLTFIIFLKFNFASANNLIFYIEAAIKNNPKLNAERENLKATKENVNISIGEFFPTISVSGDITSTQSSKRTNQLGDRMVDTSSNKETKTISVDQKIFKGFQNYNSLRKSELELKKGTFKLTRVKQEVILSTASAYYDYIYKTKNKIFNSANLDLFERQVESDSARLQRGEITLTDLAQSESSLAGANAKLIIAETELLTSKTEFTRLTGFNVPESIENILPIKINLPKSLKESLNTAEKNNQKLMIAKLNYEIAKRNVDIEKAKLSPSASINYTKSKNQDFSPSVDDTDQEVIKATVKWPLLNGTKNFSSIKKSKFKKNQSSLLLNDAVNITKTEITNAWSVYQSSQSVLKATKAQVKAAEIANEGISLEYDSGKTRTTLELIQSRTLLLDARISNAIAERDFIISKYKLLDQIGRLSLKNIKKT